MFGLCYTQHQGSGLHFGYDEVRAMPMSEILEWTRMLDEQRTAEAKKLKKK